MPNSANSFDVIVLGAGAAGLLCAFTAARRGRRVLVLEKANKIGKKILMSGGGRCNFTNYSVEADNFISANRHFCKSALKQYTQWDFIAMVDRYGIDYSERRHGQLFCTHSAKEILAMLLQECEQAGVQIETKCDIKDVKAISQGSYRFSVEVNEREIICESVVIATGALSIPTLGGGGYGYEIARKFGLEVTELRAGLVPFMFSDSKLKPLCERLSGVSIEVTASCNGQSFTENLLFTHRGISGPVILQISNYWQPGDEVSIDLIPALDASAWLMSAKEEHSKSRLPALLGQKLGKSLARELLALLWPEGADRPLAEYSDQQLTAFGRKLSDWRLKPSATEGYRTAEVTLGGVATDAISSKTMEVKLHPGLFFVGEVLDVTGHLGGFNFQWAWSSGYCAGMAS
jgi:predicted Rossmann fold flavoprotein